MTMAPTVAQVETQTREIIFCLFDDDDSSECRTLSSSGEGAIETDSYDNFDPVLVADKLRQIADAMNEDATFKTAVNELKSAAAHEALETALGSYVEAVCQAQVCQKSEVAPEMQLIKATVAFGLYVKKSSPDLIVKVQGAMTSFLNRRVGTWVTQQGGWDKVAR